MNLKDLADSQLCSVVSKRNGVDPIGSAKTCDGWLVIEWPQPWIIDHLMSDPLIIKIFPLIQQCEQEKGINIQPVLIAPERHYSVDHQTRILYYQRADDREKAKESANKIPFAAYTKQEFLSPKKQIISLIKALIVEPDKLSHFDAYKQATNNIRDILVCTHGNVDLACSRFGFPIYNRLTKQYTLNNNNLRVWRCSHFGGHQFAPTLIDFPIGQVWGHLEAEILDDLIYREGNVSKLRSFYRGWTGLSKFGQIVERELWLKWGWPWLDYKKSEQIIEQYPNNNIDDVEWIKLTLEAIPPDNKVKYIYHATVEVSGEIETVKSSGEKSTLVKQYRVSQCKEMIKNIQA